MRASDGVDAIEKNELLRGVAGTVTTPPSELMRAVESLPEKNAPKKPGLLGKLFKRA